MGIALNSIAILVSWYSLYYGFCPGLSLALPSNSPTTHVIELLRPVCAPKSSKFAALCRKRAQGDVFQHCFD